jgi:hypothetical protein
MQKFLDQHINQATLQTNMSEAREYFYKITNSSEQEIHENQELEATQCENEYSMNISEE